jgi:carbonic anhydrase/acetyltransferase-like protein (isoleucine patch superfamily)
MFVEVHINRKIPTMKSLKERLKHPPKKASSAFIAPNATVIGTVELGEQSSVWFGAVLRGDTDLIQVGDRSNIQDNAVLHADPGDPCIICHDCVIAKCAELPKRQSICEKKGVFTTPPFYYI